MAIAQPDRTVGQRRPRPFAFVTFCGPASKVWQSNVVSTPPSFGGLSKQINQKHTHTHGNTRSTQDMEMETMSVGGHLGIQVLATGHRTTDHWRPTYV